MKFLIKLISTLLALTLSHSAFALFSPNQISYREVGFGQPIIFIHAFPTDKDIYVPQEYAFAKHYHVISIDLWGFGGSPNTDGSVITMAQYANEVYQLIAKMHLQKCVIAGESMGGYIALALLQAHPEVVRALILSDTQSIAETPKNSRYAQLLAQNAMLNGPAVLKASFMQTALSPNASPRTRAYLQNIVQRQTKEAMSSALLGMAIRPDVSDVLTKATIPILIITGAEDKVIFPEQSEQMHQLAKASTLVVIPNTGHLSNLEQPDAWNKATETFLEHL